MSDAKAKAGLYKKIAAVMGKVSHVPKNGFNAFHKYKFVQESDLVDHVRKFMCEEGLALITNVKSYEIEGEIATVEMEFTLACTDTGESITSVMYGQGQDKGDKKFYKAYAGATKYYLMKTFLVPTGDDPEADTTTDERNHAKQEEKPKSKPEEKPEFKKIGIITAEQVGTIKTLVLQFAGLYPGKKDVDVYAALKITSLPKLNTQQADAAIEKLNKWIASFKAGEEKKGA